jgi:hypothetical protein
MPRPQKKKKNSNKPIAEVPVAIAKIERPPARTDAARMARDFSILVGSLCSTKMEVAFIAAEMLLHIGRGQMAAQLGHNFSHENDDQLDEIMSETVIFDYPSNPNQDSTAERLFLGFVKSIAKNDPEGKKQQWKTNGNNDLPFIAALSFLVGNLAWQKRSVTATNPNPRMTRQNVKDAFDAVAGKHCPPNAPPQGGGPWCEWMDL